ncbi:sugar ABC transporter permease [Paenibacillus thalictri]|uniref:Sugar ABC transporter permease n=1 Tax=Paenibacillus thalictri TaxID=2527873 RepID=A0A4Q9DIV0_9BACL|nr:sugar ABC transporter permease [Paenibacillus thalictri]
MTMWWKQWKRNVPGYLFIGPSLILFLVFLAYPAVEAVRISFYRLTMSENEFIGWDNFRKLFQDDTFLMAFGNTFKYVLYIVPVCVAFSILIAVLIHSMSERWAAFYRGVFYIPVVASVVSISLVWAAAFEPVIGILNYFLSVLHMAPVTWLADPNTAFFSLVFIIISWSVGQPIILYSAALGGISSEYYEAASMDGAGRLRKFVNITWPLVKPTTLYILVITTIHAFQTFAVINLLTKGGPYGTTTSVIYELYQHAFVYTDFGYASAMGTVLFVLIGIVSYFQFRFMTAKIEF